MKKILWLFVLIITIYILLIFKAPNITKKVEKTLWFSWFTEAVTGTKWNLDKTYTNLPTKDEAFSWIIDIKNKIINWVNTTKSKIDDVRSAAAWAEKQINQVKKTYNNAINVVKKTNQQIQNTKKTIDNISKSINQATNTWTIN